MCARTSKTLLILCLFLSGCALTSEEYEKSISDFRTRLAEETEQYWIENPAPLTLDVALELGRMRSLNLTEQRLNQELAQINRLSAFSTFLPRLDLAYGRVRAQGDSTVPSFLHARDAHDQGDELALFVTQPVFVPNSWILFAEAMQGVRIQNLIHARAIELLDLHVATSFYQVLTAQRRMRTTEQFKASAIALTNRITRLAQEGFARSNDVLQARAHLAQIEHALLQAQHQASSARARLCETLSFWPTTNFDVDEDSFLSLPNEPDQPLEEALWQALLLRKDARAGAENVHLRKTQVLEAISNFLPNLVLGTSASHLSVESILSKGNASALLGTWALFNGFKNVQEYRAARAHKKSEFALQEQRLLVILVGVITAEQNQREARTQLQTAQLVFKSAQTERDQTSLRFQEGTETFRELLRQQALFEEAQEKLIACEGALKLTHLVARVTRGRPLLQKDEP